MSWTRRSFLGGATAAGLSTWFGGSLCRAVDRLEPTGPFRRCLVMWMEGGPEPV